MPIHWTKPTIVGAPSFAQIDSVVVGYVTKTAFADGRWCATVLPHGEATPGYYCYAGTEARAKSFVENWLKYHAPDTTGWRKVGEPWRDPPAGLPPRKPKGSDDRF